jgi:hypothetical protein
VLSSPHSPCVFQLIRTPACHVGFESVAPARSDPKPFLLSKSHCLYYFRYADFTNRGVEAR